MNRLCTGLVFKHSIEFKSIFYKMKLCLNFEGKKKLSRVISKVCKHTPHEVCLAYQFNSPSPLYLNLQWPKSYNYFCTLLTTSGWIINDVYLIICFPFLFFFLIGKCFGKPYIHEYFQARIKENWVGGRLLISCTCIISY